ncbi:MAG: acetoacetate metabolism transcriptional regulator AtoC [Acidobacteriota bacterium]
MAGVIAQTVPIEALVAIITPDDALREDLAARAARLGIRSAGSLDLADLDPGKRGAAVDAVLLDMRAIDHRQARLLTRLLEREGAPPVLLLADATDEAQAFEWIVRGASDVISRPPGTAELRVRLLRALESRDVRVHLATLEDELARRSRRSWEDRAIVALSPAMERLRTLVQRVAPMRSTVLVTGESGVGKELVARSIHFDSPRAAGPFIALNCAALPPHLIESDLFGHERGAFTGAVSRRAGKFELAHQGTLFLDEIAETDLATQAKLLRVLEDQEFMRVGGTRPIRVDVRLVAATNADLEALVRRGEFREDLYYRLRVVTLRVPPLRERREDIPVLAREFLTRVCRENRLEPRRLSPEALEALLTHDWPGNVRELQNAIEAAVVSSRGSVITAADLPPAIRSRSADESSRSNGPLAGRSLREIEADAIRQTLELVSGSRTRAARLLGIGVRTLRRRIQELGLDASMPARPGRPRSREGRSSS